MNEVYLEQRMVHSKNSLTKDLARHLFARGRQGRVAIITDNPPGLHAALRKQWVVLLRQVQRERSSTLRAVRILILSEQISWMQHVSFAKNTPAEQPADVYITTADKYLETSDTFNALYITDRTPPEVLAGNMQEGIVVAYSFS